MHLSACVPRPRRGAHWFAAEPNNVLSHEAFIAPSNIQRSRAPGDGPSRPARHARTAAERKFDWTRSGLEGVAKPTNTRSIFIRGSRGVRLPDRYPLG